MVTGAHKLRRTVSIAKKKAYLRQLLLTSYQLSCIFHPRKFSPVRPKYRNDSQPPGFRIDQNFLGKSSFHSSHLQEVCSLLHIFGLGNLPLFDNIGLSCRTLWLECHLERVRPDNEQRVWLVQRNINLQACSRIDLLIEVEGLCEASASDDQLVLGKTLTKARSLAPAKRRHSFDIGILRKEFLISGPSRSYPALWAVVFRVWVFRGIAEESP